MSHKPHILEQKHQQLAPIPVFLKRSVIFFLWAAGVVFTALLIGIAGYHWIAGLNWIDSLLNAAMVLTGAGSVDRLPNDASKVFASIYVLFGSIVFIVVTGIVLSPLMHRVLHKFHIKDNG